ncbi:MAG TPA: exo-alpha-sialidase, partial [Chloroflexia bacterium]|nr:exo-alpha-sialidase [Chloroflexia bacterium]
VSRVHTNTVIVASKDYRQGNVKRVWIDGSTDGGATWPVQVHMPNLPPTDSESDPVVMARDDGRIYVSCLTTGNNGIWITWTDDDGQTWHPSVPIIQNQGGLQDKEWFAIDNNPASPYYHRMYMMYVPDPGFGSGVVEHHSTDGGLTWSGQQPIAGNDTEYTYPVIASDGTVYNFMMENWGFGQTGTVQMTKSTNGGVTWSAPANVATAFQPNSPIRQPDEFRFFAIISAAVDPINGNLYVAWTDNRNFNTNGTDVVYVRSTNGGASWSAVTRLSHDPTGVVRDHITPMLTVGADGKLHAFWLDRRLDPNNRLFDSWYSSSTDGGNTWEPDTRVSTISQDLNVGLPCCPGNYPAGDYWGLDTALDTVYVAWNDTRSGDQDILVAKGLMNFSGPPTASPTATGTPPTATSTRTATSTAVPTNTATVSATPATPASTATPTAQGSATATRTATVAVTPQPACDISWQVVTGPDTEGTSVLNGVDALSASDIWAVGSTCCSQFFVPESLALHWDGAAWTHIPSPSFMRGSALFSVSAISSDNVWAVGESYDVGGLPYLLILRWDGVAWTSFYPGVSSFDKGLRSVIALDSNNVWAVGYEADGAGGYRALVLHWNVASWSQETTPSLPASSRLNGVSGTAASDIWAVGYVSDTQSLVLRRDGSTWASVPSPNIGPLNAVEVIASDDVWAASDSGFIHWDGTSWTEVGGVSGATALSAASSNDIWAGGNFMQHWDGVSGEWQADLTAPSAIVYGVSAIAGDDVWAVGRDGDHIRILHYTAQQFTDVPPTNTFYPHVQCLACRGIIGGYPCGGAGEPCGADNLPYFRPNNSITRGQIAKIVSNSAGFNEGPGEQIFEDVPEGSPFYAWINRLAMRGHMAGYPCGAMPSEPCSTDSKPYFRPNANATRGQLAKIVSNAAQFQDDPGPQIYEDVPTNNTFFAFINRLSNRVVMGGYPCGILPGEPCMPPSNRPYFRWAADVTRGQASKIVANTFFPGCETRIRP